jgi:4-hydroxybenzoate polyprenyltransferase
MRNILRIIRYKNLIIVAATLYLMRYCIIQPLLVRKGLDLQLDGISFMLLVLAAMLITAGGYVINDYFDTRTDLVNRPQTVVVGRSISRRSAILLHLGLNVVGILLAFIVSVEVGRPILTILFILAAGVLWFYSTTYKRQFLLGNLIVAIMTGAVPLLALLYELPKIYGAYWDLVTRFKLSITSLTYWVGGYALFAFLLTLVREIIKDIEDFEGDTVFGRNTLPIYLGINSARIITASILFVTLIVLVYLFAAYLNFLPSGEFDYITLFYFLLGLVIPIFILLVKLLTAQGKNDYHLASRICKLIMLFGLLYAVVFRFLII